NDNDNDNGNDHDHDDHDSRNNKNNHNKNNDSDLQQLMLQMQGKGGGRIGNGTDTANVLGKENQVISSRTPRQYVTSPLNIAVLYSHGFMSPIKMVDGNLLPCDTLFKVSNVSQDCDLWLKGYHLFKKSFNERSDIGLSIVLRPEENEQYLADKTTPIVPPESVAHFICSNCDGGYLIFELYAGIDIRQSCQTNSAKRHLPTANGSANRANNLSQCRANRLMTTMNASGERRSPSIWTGFISLPSNLSPSSVTESNHIRSTASNNLHINTMFGDMFEPLWMDLIIGWRYDPIEKKCRLFALFHEFRTIEEYRKEMNEWEVFNFYYPNIYVHMHMYRRFYCVTFVCDFQFSSFFFFLLVILKDSKHKYLRLLEKNKTFNTLTLQFLTIPTSFLKNIHKNMITTPVSLTLIEFPVFLLILLSFFFFFCFVLLFLFVFSKKKNCCLNPFSHQVYVFLFVYFECVWVSFVFVSHYFFIVTLFFFFPKPFFLRNYF
ncbi:hypothetical protein RFI_27748, partial [Reticulomyxa filosa]